MTGPVTLTHDNTLLVRWLPGTSRHLVLAFTGIEHGMGGLPVDEFFGTASDNRRNHVLFISDLKRTWFSSRKLVQKIVAAVQTFIVQHRISTTTSIGNSMGGYGAILFSALLPVHHVVAFVPQISMHPAVLLETRWIRFRPAFGPDLPHSLLPSIERAKARIFVFFGQNNQADVAQAALLPAHNRVIVRTLHNCGHNAAAFMKKMGLLAPLLADILKTGGARTDHILRGYV